ncbi:MAG: hypothetical protein HYX68_09670 [Planctomycetes bacterium]|nr:hypothetical protein [Planctomycetota bacterium]
MPSVTVSDEVFNRLAEQASARNVTIEQLVAPLLELAAGSNAIQGPASTPAFEDWKQGFGAWMSDVQRRANRYPPGFVLDDSRESIYQACGE